VRIPEVRHLGAAGPGAEGVLSPRVSARHWATRLHLPTLGVAAVIVAGWVLLSWRYGAYVLPSPLAVARGFAEIVASGEIWRHTVASLGRILVGFGGAVVVALLAGFGLALKVSVVAEIFGVTSGIGYVMNYSREILATQMVFVWALVMILVMTATDRLVFDAVSRRLDRWR